MVESGKELSKRLEPAKRQFHQWHYREGQPIRRVKEMMDELSYHLRKTSAYDFRADEDKWKYRAREWGGKEWNIKKGDRGLHLPTPNNVSHLPIWQIEKGDVGTWRNTALAANDGSQPTSLSAEQDLQTSQGATQGFGFWDLRKTSQLERPWNDVRCQSSSGTSASFISTQTSYNPIADMGHHQHGHHASNIAEIAQWTNSVTPPFTDIHPPMLPYDDQNNSLQYNSQAYGELYGPPLTTAPPLATYAASEGHSTDAIYAPNRYPNPYEAGNMPLTQTPHSTTSMEFDPMTSHTHGYLQLSRAHGQDFTYGTQTPTLSAQVPPTHSNNQTEHSYEGGSTSDGHNGSQSLY